MAARFLESLWPCGLEMHSWTHIKVPLKARCNTQCFTAGSAELLWCLCVHQRLDKMEKVTRKGNKTQEKKKI